MNESKSLEEAIGYVFKDKELLKTAMTHRSASPNHNERLEFLGDSVLNSSITKYLYDTYPESKEGELSRLRSNLVSAESLAQLAKQIGLGEQLIIGEGEEKTAARTRVSLLADSMEALFGAVWSEGGFEEGRKVVLRLFQPFIESNYEQAREKDSKTLLQEWLQANGHYKPRYEVARMDGQHNAPTFHVRCVLPDGRETKGIGESKKAAEQEAAKKALGLITREDDR